MSQLHTGKIFKDTILDTIEEFNIAEKFLSLSTDNASNMIHGFDLLASEMLTKYGRNIYHIRCGAHILNLAVQDGLKHIFDIEEEFDEDQPTSPLTKLRLCINTIRRSPKITKQLEEICDLQHINFCKLPNDCPTRWSSTYEMIRVAIKQKVALQTLFVTTDIKYIKNALDYSDWEILEENIPILEVFAEATNALSTFKRPTLYQVDEIFCGIQVYLQTFKTNVSKSMIEKIQDYSIKLSQAHWIVQILHPGIKLTKTDKKYHMKLTELKKQADFIVKTIPNPKNVPLNSSTSGKKTAIAKFRQLIGDTIDVDQDISQAPYNSNIEINRYLASLKVDKDDDPLIWWNLNEKTYPILAILARNYFAIPASSVPCEQLFSIAGNTVTKNRNSLVPETVQALLCLKSWFSFIKNHRLE